MVVIALGVGGLLRPQHISVTSLLISALIVVSILAATLVFMPVTKYIEVEKLLELRPPSLAFSLNGLRGVPATFHFRPGTGEPITGKLVERHNSRGTVGIEVEKNGTKIMVTVLVADICRLGVEESNWHKAKSPAEEYSEAR